MAMVLETLSHFYLCWILRSRPSCHKVARTTTRPQPLGSAPYPESTKNIIRSQQQLNIVQDRFEQLQARSTVERQQKASQSRQIKTRTAANLEQTVGTKEKCLF